jgi:hypothetical protein
MGITARHLAAVVLAVVALGGSTCSPEKSYDSSSSSFVAAPEVSRWQYASKGGETFMLGRCWQVKAARRRGSATAKRLGSQLETFKRQRSQVRDRGVNMRATIARMHKPRNVRASPTMFEPQPQPEVPVPVPTGPRASRSFVWVSSRDTEIYPLVFCVAVGVAIGTFSGVRHLALNPDVSLSRHRRETPSWERYTPEEGETCSRNRHHLATLKPNPVNALPAAAALTDGTDEPFTKHL